MALTKKTGSQYYTVMKSTFMKGSVIKFLNSLSGSKVGWVSFNEKIKINTVTAWDGKDASAPTYEDEYDVEDDKADTKKTEDL